MQLANLLVPLFTIVFLAAIIWKHRFVQIGALVLTYAGFIYYALNFIPEL